MAVAYSSGDWLHGDDVDVLREIGKVGMNIASVESG